MSDLQDAALFEQRLEGRERLLLGNLLRVQAAAEQAIGIAAAVAAFAMRERDVTGLVRSDRQCNAAERRLHRVDAERLDVDRNDSQIEGARDPGFEPIDAAHDLVACALDLARACRFQPHRGELLRGCCDRRLGCAGTRLDRHAAAGERQAG